MGKFFEASHEEEDECYRSERYKGKKRSPAWPKGQYTDQVADGRSPDPLKD